MVSLEWHWKLSLGLRTHLHTYVCICTHTSKTQETTAKRNSQVARMHSRSGLGIKLEFFSFVYYYYFNESSSGLGWSQIGCMANNFELLSLWSSYFRIQSTKNYMPPRPGLCRAEDWISMHAEQARLGCIPNPWTRSSQEFELAPGSVSDRTWCFRCSSLAILSKVVSLPP